MKFWQELKQLINLVLDVLLLIENVNMLALTVRERSLSKGKIRAILSPYLAEH